MASLESTTTMVLSSSVLMREEKKDQEEDQHYSLARRSVRTSSATYTSEVLHNFDDDHDHATQLFLSNLSLKCLVSKEVPFPSDFGPLSDSDSDPFRSPLFSTIPPHKVCCNREKDCQLGGAIKRKSLMNKRSVERDGSMEQSNGCGGGGIVVITRPKGGRKSLCMDLEEVKACQDLGLDLEHEWMLEVLSSGRRGGGGGGCGVSGANVGPNCGGDSATRSWRISNPGK